MDEAEEYSDEVSEAGSESEPVDSKKSEEEGTGSSLETWLTTLDSGASVDEGAEGSSVVEDSEYSVELGSGTEVEGTTSSDVVEML
jgi:hypothetical protein